MQFRKGEQFRSEKNGFELSSEKLIPEEGKPDPKFRKVFGTRYGQIIVDPSKKNPRILTLGHTGSQFAECEVPHDFYRFAASPFNDFFTCLSRDSVLYAYDKKGSVARRLDLRQNPQVKALQSHFAVPEENLKNHIRCVGSSSDGTRYLFTMVDEAWCLDGAGRVIWGARLPIKPGHTKYRSVVEPNQRRPEIDKALSKLSLTPPVNAPELKSAYREMALKWHPDRNPDRPEAKARMQEINEAYEVLANAPAPELAMVDHEVNMYRVDDTHQSFDIGGLSMDMSMVVPEIHAKDWIYAAVFVRDTHKVALLGYSGLLVELDSGGNPERVVVLPTTSTLALSISSGVAVQLRGGFMVISDRGEANSIQTGETSQLLAYEKGFSVLTNKELHLYSGTSKPLGTVFSKSPIRRVWHDGNSLRLQTRQREAAFSGVPAWRTSNGGPAVHPGL